MTLRTNTVLAALIAATAPTATIAQPITESTKLTASNAMEGAAFGRSVSVSGEVALVGANNQGSSGPFFFDGPGAAYVYRLVGSDWIETAEIPAPPTVTGLANGFGFSVSISGDLALIGAPGDHDRASSAGAAYVFRFDGTQWNLETKITASDGARDDIFGTSVAIDGNTAIVGAPQNTLTGPGWAYVYRYDGAQWVEETKLVAPDGGADDAFGSSVAVRGDVAAVGARNHGNTGLSFPDGAGAVYMFNFNGTSWDERDKLVPVDAPTGQKELFGSSVSIDETASIVAIGTDAITFGPFPPTGSAYVFRDEGDGWLFDAKLIPEGITTLSKTVSISGDTILAGAWREWSVGGGCPFPNICRSGSAYTFRFDGKNWNEHATLNASDIADGDNFGWSVALSGSAAFIGAWRDEDHGINSGSAYVFDLGCTADTNNDGVLTPTDFTAWINAFNNQLPECDQNNDGACTPTDFTAWIANFNKGCP